MAADLPPPPCYADAVRLSEGTSDPLINPDDGTGSGRNTPSHLSDSHHHRPYKSDSPHSSDDEETARLKADLRKLREEKFRLRSDSGRQEQKKQWLKEALEQEQRDIRAATGYGPVQPAYGGSTIPNPMGPHGPTAPPYCQTPQTQYGGPNYSQSGTTVIHPTVTFNPNQRSGVTPLTSVQIGQTDTNTDTAPATVSDWRGVQPNVYRYIGIALVLGIACFIFWTLFFRRPVRYRSD